MRTTAQNIPLIEHSMKSDNFKSNGYHAFTLLLTVEYYTL